MRLKKDVSLPRLLPICEKGKQRIRTSPAGSAKTAMPASPVIPTVSTRTHFVGREPRISCRSSTRWWRRMTSNHGVRRQFPIQYIPTSWPRIMINTLVRSAVGGSIRQGDCHGFRLNPHQSALLHRPSHRFLMVGGISRRVPVPGRPLLAECCRLPFVYRAWRRSASLQDFAASMPATGGTHCRPPDPRLASLCCRGIALSNQ